MKVLDSRFSIREGGSFLLAMGGSLVLMATLVAQTPDFPDRYWPAFPAPGRVLIGKSLNKISFADAVLLQTLSGLAAYEARQQGKGEMIWMGLTANTSYDEWFRRCLSYIGSPCDKNRVFDVWELTTRCLDQGIVRGYVLYRSDKSERKLYARRPTETSVNVATALCPLLHGVAVEESLQVQAKAHGLPLLMDVRGKDEHWLWEKFGERFSRYVLALQDPKSAIVRASALAMKAFLLSGEGDLYESALTRLRPGSPVLGWGIGQEDAITGPSSRYAAFQTAANWCANLPVLSSGATGLAYPFIPFRSSAMAVKNQEVKQADTQLSVASEQDEGTRYVSFILSDGDNVQWLMLNFCLGNDAKQLWACPDRGRMPFGWSIPAMDLLQLCPYTLDYLRETATPNDDFVLMSGGYYCPDWFGAARSEKDLLAKQARRTGKYMRRCGLSTLAVNAQDWDSGAALSAYRVYAGEIQGLDCIFVIQCSPYTAGKGAIRWVTAKDGGEMPVITARYALWSQRGAHPSEGAPGKVAALLNRWAVQPVHKLEDRFAWVIVHCWSWFRHSERDAPRTAEEVDQKQSAEKDIAPGYRPALWCSERLSSRIQVVTPAELLRRLRQARESSHGN